MRSRISIFARLLLVSGGFGALAIIFAFLSHLLVQMTALENWEILAGFTCVVVILVLGAAALHIHIFVRSVAPILKGLNEVQQGRYPLLLAEGKDELAELIRGFNQMVEELRAREERLRSWAGTAQSQVSKLSETVKEERQKLEKVLDSVGEGAIVLDEENKVLMANSRVGDILGLPVGSVIGAGFDELVEQLRHRLVEPETVQSRVRGMKPGEADQGISLELDAPGGQQIRLFSAPVRGSSGKVLARIATFLDLRKEHELERLKTEFLSTVSHELRTPLTSVKGALGLIRAGAAGHVTADIRELLEIAAVNVDRLVGVINNILDISNLERGRSPFRMSSAFVARIAEKAAQDMQAESEQAGVTLENMAPLNLPPVHVDARRIEQVLINLVSNAIKFSPRGIQGADWGGKRSAGGDGFRPGLRQGHSPGIHGPALREVRTSRGSIAAQHPGRRPGPGHHPAHRGQPPRPHLGRKRARQADYVLLHAAPASGGRGGQHRRPDRRPPGGSRQVHPGNRR